MSIVFGILTVSDSCHYHGKTDTAGQRLFARIKETFTTADITYVTVVPDEKIAIQKMLTAWIDYKCHVIFTVGGTGFSPRDVTPEATRAVIEREAPGLAYAMCAKGLASTPMAMMSRAVCGIRNRSLIVNLPGSEKGALECFSYVQEVIPHCVALLTDDLRTVQEHHQVVQKQQADNSDTPSKVRIDVAGRDRVSVWPLVEVDDAIDIILKNYRMTDVEMTEVLQIDATLNRVLASDIKSRSDIPSCDVSLKDGYAVVAPLDNSSFSSLYTVVESVAAGQQSTKKVLVSEAVRITTGAPIPSGANAVVQVEDTVLVETVGLNGVEELKIEVKKCPVAGQDIRFQGSDIKQGTIVLKRCDRIKAAHIGILASLGFTDVTVYKRPSIGLISTGNELQSHKERVLKPGKIFDSNKLTLMNLLKQHSYSANDCGIAQDEPDDLKLKLDRALRQNDIVITTGGVSMGEFDLVKRVLVDDFNATIHFGRVNMKPGKPTTFATLKYSNELKFVFGLPGNPVSASVTCLLFVVPLLKYLECSGNCTYCTIRARAGECIENSDSRPEYVRGRLVFEDSNLPYFYSTGNQISSRLNSLVGANCLAIVKGRKSKDETLDVYVIDDL